MKPAAYAPDAGDIIWLTLAPTAGHEQAGHRPALVLSPEAYNTRVGLAICCPITSHVKGYPFEVALPPDLPVKGVVLADQVRSVDWRSRHAEFAGKVTREVLAEVMDRLAALLPRPD